MVAPRTVLSLNVGSSSLKFGLFQFEAGSERLLARGAVERIGQRDPQLWLERTGGAREPAELSGGDHAAAVQSALAALARLQLPAAEAIGHRLVHGGPNQSAPARIDAALLASLRAAVRYAPLHLPPALAAIEVLARAQPELPQVACFDTAFHAELPEVARRFALPRALYDAGVRRYGFHGLAFESVVAQLGAAGLGRAVLAHLGSGASLAAVRGGRSLDTTMGLTPTGGIPMSTRSGDLDPGVIMYLLAAGYDRARLARVLDHESGLLGVSGTSGDVRTLLERRATDPAAALALDMFAYQVHKTIGGYAAVLGGLDNLVFSGGIGEHAAAVREQCCRGLEWLGVQLEPARNARSEPVISPDAASCTVRVVATDEEQIIARHTQRLSRAEL